ncbi:hypothetical protein [Wenzhouxiangella marina]|nr:hypothetical protein [Wenzhouxiangella marina]MBB6088066.1 hypothetical protein [Wenzhouxiangella marina]
MLARTVALTLLLLTGLAIAQDELTDQRVPPSASIQGATVPAIEIVFTNVTGDPSAAVPGFPGFEFFPGGGTSNFDRIYGSPNGNWIVSANTTAPSTENEVILVNGVTSAREGTPAPWTGGAENFGVFRTEMAINDNGDWAFSTNTDGPSGNDEYVVRVINGSFASVAQEGQAILAVPGASWGPVIRNVVMDELGNVGLVSSGVTGVDPSQSELLVLGPIVLAQSGVTVPPGQVGSEFWDNFDFIDSHLSADGSRWLIQGDLTGDTASDDVVVVDGNVVVQEGSILSGSSFSEAVDTSGIVGVHMDAGGNWFVRGNNAGTEQDWVYRNGEIIASTGAPVTTGSAELWSDIDFSDCFFLHAGNSRGDYVIGGVTDGDSASNGVLVANGEFVVVREGDPVDLNGNGLDDDNLFFNTFGNDDGYLSDTGLFYFTATIKEASGSPVAQGIFVADLSTALGLNDGIFADRFE